MRNNQSQSAMDPRVNNFLRTFFAVLLLLTALQIPYIILSIPQFYQRAVTGTLPDDAAQGTNQVTNARIAQEAAIRGLTIPRYAAYRIAIDLLYSVVFYAVALVILLRAGGQWFLWYAAFILFFVPGGQLHAYVPQDHALARYLIVLSLAWPAFPLFLYLFPNGRAVPRWMSWLIGPILAVHLAFQAIGSLSVISQGKFDLIPALKPYLGILILSFPFALIAQVYRYLRVSNREERLQTKWVVGGFITTVAGNVAISILFGQTDFTKDYGFSGDVTNMLLLFMPITIGISILRYRLYDIDLIIRKTIQYGLLSVLLGLLYFGLIVVLGSVFRGMTGQESPVVIALSTLVIAALFNPLRRRLQAWIDRRFYRRRYDAEQAVASFSSAARSEVESEALTSRLMEAVQEALQPAMAWVWIRKERRHD